MRVALLSRAVSPLHGFGGLERHVAALAKYLELSGVDVTIYTTPHRGDSTPAGVEPVPYRSIPWPAGKGFVVLDRNTNYLLWSRRAARRVLDDARADIVQADGGAGFGYALLREVDSPPLVLHPHGMEEFKAPEPKRSVYLPLRSAIRFAAKSAARVLAPDASMKKEVETHLGVEAARISVLPNAIDLSTIDRSVRVDSLHPYANPVLLSVGRLEKNKGFLYLIRALGEVREKLPPSWLWLLVGDGPERAGLEKAIASSGIGLHARLLGQVEDDELFGLYERATLFVHPTLYEGSSLVTLEAMAHRKAVVASRVGGIPDKIIEGETGLLVPPGDPGALGAALLQALSSGKLDSWGARARAVVEMRFSWSQRIKEVVALYETILTERG